MVPGEHYFLLPSNKEMFQFHRDMMVAAVIIEVSLASLCEITQIIKVLAVIGIFWQAGWVFFECSYECTNDVRFIYGLTFL